MQTATPPSSTTSAIVELPNSWKRLAECAGRVMPSVDGKKFGSYGGTGPAIALLTASVLMLSCIAGCMNNSATDWGYIAVYNQMSLSGSSSKQFSSLSFGSTGDNPALPDIVIRFEDGTVAAAREMAESDIPDDLGTATQFEKLGKNYVSYEIPSTLIFHDGKLCQARLLSDVEIRRSNSSLFVRLPLSDTELTEAFGKPNMYRKWTKSN